MLDRLKRMWDEFDNDPPGNRFQARYRRRQSTLHNPFAKFLYVGGGIVILAAGIFFLPAPGPGMLIVLLGAALIAQESLAAARALDWIDPRVRSLLLWLKSAWERSSLPVKALLGLVGAALAAGAAYVAYRTFLGA